MYVNTRKTKERLSNRKKRKNGKVSQRRISKENKKGRQVQKHSKRIDAKVMLDESYCYSAMNIESSLTHNHSNACKTITYFYWDCRWSTFPNN